MELTVKHKRFYYQEFDYKSSLNFLSIYTPNSAFACALPLSVMIKFVLLSADKNWFETNFFMFVERFLLLVEVALFVVAYI